MFIAIEGIDGSGKSTLIKKLASSMERLNKPVVYGPALGSGKYGMWARKLVMSNTLIMEERMDVMALATSHTVEDFVLPNLINNNVVILDRYVGSFYAYQGMEDSKRMLSIYNSKLKYLTKPDIYIHCNTPVEICAGRLNQKPDIDNMDQTYINKLEIISDNYKKFFDMSEDNVITYDSSLNQTKNYLSLVKSILKLNNDKEAYNV